LDDFKNKFINNYIKSINPDNVVLDRKEYLNELQSRLSLYIPTQGIIYQDRPLKENYTFPLKQSILKIIYYELYKTKYDDLLRASIFYEKITDKSLVNDWYDSSIKLSDALRKFLKDSFKPLLTRENEAGERPVDPQDLRPGTRLLGFTKGLAQGVVQGKSVIAASKDTAKDLYGKKTYKNSINTDLISIKGTNGEDSLFELKETNDGHKNAFNNKLKTTSDSKLENIFTRPLTRILKLGLKDKLKTHKPGTSQELLDDIDLWSKFWKSLPSQTPALALVQSAPPPP